MLFRSVSQSRYVESNRLDKVRYDLEELIYRQKTVKRLLEAMPEAANYLPEAEKETGAVPAIIKPQDLLNKLA